MPPSSRGPEVRGRTRWSYRAKYDGARPRLADRGYNRRTTPNSPGESPSTTSRPPTPSLANRPTFDLVRLRLFLALVTMFAIPIAIAAPVIYGLAWGFGTSLVVPTLGLLLLAVILGTLTLWLARRVLEPAERLEQARLILEDAYDRARAEALRDTLTGLGNHRAFQEEMERQWAAATRHGQPLALAIVDLDDFKQINDARGHAAGDLLLRQAATTMASYLRRSDRAFRVGGDEFAIILAGHRRGERPGDDPAAAGGLPRRREGRPRPDRGLVLGRDQRDLAACARPRRALQRGRGRAALEQAPRPDVRHGLRPRAARRPDRGATEGRAVGARRAGGRDRRDPGRLPADLRPVERSAARVRGPGPAAARQRLRGSGRDVRRGRGHRADRRARHRLHEHGHGDRRPVASARASSRSTSRRARSRWTTSASTPCSG